MFFGAPEFWFEIFFKGDAVRKFLTQKKMCWMVMLGVVVFSFSSCVYCVVGGLGALGGYVISPDMVEGTIVDRDYDEIWKTSVEVLSAMGMLEQESEGIGMLQARLEGARVQVQVIRMGKKAVTVNVKARQSIFPKVKIAQQVYVKIVSALDVDAFDE